MPRFKGKAKTTIRQQKAIDILAENIGKKGLTMGQVLTEAGYSKSVANTPQRVTESLGFLEKADRIGLTEDFLLQCLEDDIAAKPKRRTEELKLAGKWRGLERQDLRITVENVDVPDEVYNSLLARANRLAKEATE